MNIGLDAIILRFATNRSIALSSDGNFSNDAIVTIKSDYSYDIFGVPARNQETATIIFNDECNDALFYPIKIFENTNYNIELRLNGDVASLSMQHQNKPLWPFINTRLKKILKLNPSRLWFNDGIDVVIGGFLNPKEFLGSINFSIEGTNFDFFIEVQSRKLNYEVEYRKLVDEISNHHINLIHEFGSASDTQLAMNADGKPNLLSSYFHLRRIMEPERLPCAIDKIMSAPDTCLEDETNLIRISGTKGRVPNNLAKDLPRCKLLKGGPYAELFNGFSPQAIPNRTRHISLDTSANRFVKQFLTFITILVTDITEIAKLENYHSLLPELETWSLLIHSWLSRPIWKDVGNSIISFNSQKLVRLSGYREVNQVANEISEALRFPLDFSGTDTDGLVLGDVKPVHTLYEYWCYFVIRKILIELYGLEYKNNLKGSKLSLNTTLCSQPIIWIDNNDKTTISLFYHKHFTRTNNEYCDDEPLWNGSYSLPFDPDISIAVSNSETTHWLNFDAKYRLNINLDIFSDEQAQFKKDDLNKMHTYRDAILGTRGAYILYPGDNAGQSFFVRQPSPQRENYIFPSVGAFTLRPDSIEENCKNLKKFICRAVKTIVDGGKYIEEIGFSDNNK